MLIHTGSLTHSLSVSDTNSPTNGGRRRFDTHSRSRHSPNLIPCASGSSVDQLIVFVCRRM